MDYSPINQGQGAASGVSSAPAPAAAARTFSLKHLLGVAAAAAALTLCVVHLATAPRRTLRYAPPAAHPAYAPYAARYAATRAGPVGMALMDMSPTAHGFVPINSCATLIGKGVCTGVMDQYRVTVKRQCSKDLGGAKPTECKCSGVKSKIYTPIVSHSELMGGFLCVCEFWTASPGNTYWMMSLKCEK